MVLTKEQITKFKNRLEELKAQMTHLIRDTIEDVRATDEIKGYSQHQADEGTDDFNRTINLQLSGNEREILQKIEIALDKIDQGTYGTCDLTGEEIPLKRLEAIPYANTTVKAQEMLEKGLL
ncbi:General stress protein 16O [Candidatus Rhabdochlamydia oedothoracis]|uniref:General stress protein 16O n=1 Tax=Candidatus Rhabdochlamydia oedothoracis TaxID=2720720 RepID=A0ABX8V3E3_9BACT|nr:TraR/DksA family transcriptional regulator [Candidatus Rhabdochlamydia sp. W815]KAG6558742.1 General stress protein 16O [Candidatus Rhabdochlamydia sp. W815]MCL6756746.1 TraR/DksA family transcriptional regulator [Candidatus Rhabdochlamydia oedothoracis]QYF49396.1 General stress protein 16O [Candidatus Rhabdochlamydia oedothoracis]